MRKLIIIGSGPAGYTAGIYAARAELGPLILAGEKSGGQLMNTRLVENWPGREEGIMGPELMAAMRKQAEKIKADIVVLQILTPEMGTEIFEKMEMDNRILTYDFDLYDHLHITYRPYNLSISEMRMWHTLATLWSNLHPTAVFKNRERYKKILSFALNEIKSSLF